MKRIWTVLSGMGLFLALCVVPSFASSLYDSIMPFAASQTPAYPSGSAYAYFVGSYPSGNPSSSASDYFVAVTAGLTNGFRMVSLGFYDMQQSFTTYDNAFDVLSSRLVGTWASFTHFGSSTTGFSSNVSSLYAINQNLYVGLKEISARVLSGSVAVSNVDTHLQSGFTDIKKLLNSNL